MNSKAGRRAKPHSPTTRAKRSGRGSRDRATQIMDAALDLFADRDYASVTVNQIADAIGIRHSLIYYYFASKEDLFNQAVEGYIAKTLEDYRALAGAAGNPVEAIENWFDINVRLCAPWRKLVKIVFDYSSPRAYPRSVSDAINEFYRTERQIIASGISGGIENGVFRPVDPQRVAAFVANHINGIFFSSIMRGDVDIAASMAELKQNLWLILDYDAAGTMCPVSPQKFD